MADRRPQVRHGDHFDTVHAGEVTSPRARHDRLPEAESGRLPEASLETRHGSKLTEQPDFADGDEIARHRPVAQRGSQRQAQRKVQSRIRQLQASSEVGVDVVAAKTDSGPAAQDGHQQGEAVRVDARSGTPGTAVSARRHESLNLYQQRPRALERSPGDAAGRVLIGSGKEGPARVDDLGQSVLRHFEDSDFLRGAEPVLGRAEQPKRGGPLAFQVQHGIDEVFECFGPGKSAVLGHVADEDHRDPVSLGHLHETECTLAHLAHTAGGPFQLVGGDSLNRVDDQRDRTRLAGKLDDAADIRLCNDRDSIGGDALEQTQPGSPQPHLSGRLLAGGIQDLAAPFPAAAIRAHRQTGRGLQQQSGLADARLAAEQHRRSGHHSPTQDSVYLAYAGGDADGLGLSQPIQRLWRAGPAARAGHGTGPSLRVSFTDHRLDKRVPRPAGPALALPAEMGGAA